MDTNVAVTQLGVYSEVGTLREVLVHRPDLSLNRLTPGNCHDLLFDDVIWVKEARQEHDAFVDTLRDRNVIVHEFGAMLAQTMEIPEARSWLLDRRADVTNLGHGTSGEIRAWLDEMPAVQLATYLVGGIARAELPFAPRGLFAVTREPQEFILPPLPNQLFTRDSSCWAGKGVFINPMYWPARRPEATNLSAMYRFHPRFKNADFTRYLDPSDEHLGDMSVEGGDVMMLADGVVLIGMGERSTPQAVTEYALRLFRFGAAKRVIAGQMPRDRSNMHLDTVFSFCDRDLVTIFPAVVDHIKPFSLYPSDDGATVTVVSETRCFVDVVADAIGITGLRRVATGGDAFEAEREQWDDGNNVLAVMPGVVIGYDRNVYTNTLLRKAGIEVITIDGSETRTRPRRWPLHELPNQPGRHLMASNLHGKSILALDDFAPVEIQYLLDLAKDLKAAKRGGFEEPRLHGKNIALIFEKDSTRTRSGFEVAAHDQGAHVTYMGPSGSHIGQSETVKDTARVLGRMFDAIEFRGFAQSDVVTLGKYAGVPVYNGLTEDSHPTQILADFMTMREHTHKHLSDIRFAFMGDGRNNMAKSLAVGAVKMGMALCIGAPSSLHPGEAFIEQLGTISNTTGGSVTFETNPRTAVFGADFIYTDVWLSMGEDQALWADRIELLKPYQVNAALLTATGNALTKFMHCLPAFHNAETIMGKDIEKRFGISSMEVTDEVFESSASIVFDQAENRMHTIKAILIATLG